MNPLAFQIPIEVRFRDLDALGHVNNAVYATYFEMGRVAFLLERFGGFGPAACDFILARLEIDYRRPVLLGKECRLGLWVSAVGTTSFTFEYELEAAGELAASGRSVQVFFDYARSSKKPVPDDFRDRVRVHLAPSALTPR
jgi:acyl-CoA thioester hydrolase